MKGKKRRGWALFLEDLSSTLELKSKERGERELDGEERLFTLRGKRGET